MKSVPPQDKRNILELNKITSHHNMMTLWLSHWVIDWTLYFIPTAPKLDSNDSEWYLFPAWMTIGACLMAHIRDKYYNWHQNMVIESLSHWVIDWVFYFTPATPKLDWSWRHDFDRIPFYEQGLITTKQYVSNNCILRDIWIEPYRFKPSFCARAMACYSQLIF